MVEKKEENDLIKARAEHLKSLIDLGVDPFASQSEKTHSIKQALDLWQKNQKAWGKDVGSPVEDADKLTLAGRVTALRGHGGATFVDIEDGVDKIQLLASQSALGKQYNLWELFDLGDFVEVSGRLFITKRGEVTLHLDHFKLLTKSLRPLPDKWSGLEDTEKRYRERYADLIANPEVRQIFRTRSAIVANLRAQLESNNFMEVETPILQSLAGGATAKPFITHYNAYDADVYLRIAPELYHKRLVVGGFERVYEFAKCFRNEGVDHSHNPEFTNLEFYVAYFDYQKLMAFSEEMIRKLVKEVMQSDTTQYKDHKINWARPFERITFRDAVKHHTSIDIWAETEDSLRAKLKSLKIDTPRSADFGRMCDLLLKHMVRPNIIQPTFIIDHPTVLSPLAKSKNDKEVQRFQLLVAGEFELCNAFSELNDPNVQRERFENQQKLREKGDEEAQSYDDDFVRALEYGMPPTAGFGMGIDRLCALLTNSNTLREVILFPFMKPKGKND